MVKNHIVEAYQNKKIIIIIIIRIIERKKIIIIDIEVHHMTNIKKIRRVKEEIDHILKKEIKKNIYLKMKKNKMMKKIQAYKINKSNESQKTSLN